MATLQVRSIDKRLYGTLGRRAEQAARKFADTLREETNTAVIL